MQIRLNPYAIKVKAAYVGPDWLFDIVLLHTSTPQAIDLI